MKKILWLVAIALCFFVGNVANEADKAKANNVETFASIPETETDSIIESTTEPSYEKEEKVTYHGRCMATTKKGRQCKRNASRGSYYCWQHR